MDTGAMMENRLDEPAMALAKRFEEAGIPVSRTGNLLTAGRFEIRVGANLERETQRDSQWFIGLGIDVTLDGLPVSALRSGSIGVDATRAAAIQTAADEWSSVFGFSLIWALFPEAADFSSIAAGKYRLFESAIIIRGDAEIERFETVRGQLRSALRFLISEAFPHDPSDNWYGLYVLLISDNGENTSECRVNGHHWPELSAEVAKLSWPRQAKYTFKQFFLAVPAGGE